MSIRYVDSLNRPLTKSLFVDTIDTVQRNKGAKPIYTMRSYEHKGYPSAYQIYMNSVDEYDAAMRLVGDMKHWRKLCACSWFMKGHPKGIFEGLEQWREDKAMKDRSEALALLQEQAEKGSVTAQKAVLDSSAAKETAGRGRPKKEPDTSLQDDNNSKIAVLYNSVKKKA